MRYSRIFMAMALLTGAIGCSVLEESMDTADEPFQIVFEAAPFLDGDAGEDTKTYVTPNGNYSSYEFFWSAQDTVGIFPSEGKQMAFSMANGAGASSATFDGGAWTCKVGYTYSSYFPFVGDYYLDPTRIPVSFIGQKQVGNGNSDHFQKYDYMYAPATTKEGSFLNFSYKHLVAAVLPYVELPAGHYTELTLSLDEPLFVTEGYYDLTAATPAIVGTKFSKKIYLDLDVTFADTETLVAYVPIAPMNMTGKKLTISITDETGFVYRYTYTPGKPYAASNIYRLKAPNSLVDFASQNIVFEDDNFKAYLVNDSGVGGFFHYDTNHDGEISYREAYRIHSIDVKGTTVHSLQGIECMPKLSVLHCEGLGLEAIDVSHNPNLLLLYCSNNHLSTLDVSNNPRLAILNCSFNQLTSLDISGNPSLTSIVCDNNQLVALNVANNPLLSYLYCDNNQLTSLDLSANPKLANLTCSFNQLTALDLSSNIGLQNLNCSNNHIVSINRDTAFNSLLTLDVSNNPELEELRCSNGRVSKLDVSGCTSLNLLECSDNRLTSLDVSTNAELKWLYCYNNQLTSLDVSHNSILGDLTCSGNQITSLDLSNNTVLWSLYCYNNQLTSLDVSNNSVLRYFICAGNQLTFLDVSNNLELFILGCGNNQLTSLDVSHNSILGDLSCSGNQITSLDISNNPQLVDLSCSNNQLATLDVTNNPKLLDLYCEINQLTSLDVSHNTALRSLGCGNNLLTTLDVSNNTALTSLRCSPMPSLTTLFIYNGQAIPGVTTNRSEDNIPSGTLIAIAP